MFSFLIIFIETYSNVIHEQNMQTYILVANVKLNAKPITMLISFVSNPLLFFVASGGFTENIVSFRSRFALYLNLLT